MKRTLHNGRRTPTETYATRTVAGYEVRAYVPPHLPVDPPIQLTVQRLGALEAANRALGRLDGIDTLLPDTTLFLSMSVRKEALLSSQIEGTRSRSSPISSSRRSTRCRVFRWTT